MSGWEFNGNGIKTVLLYNVWGDNICTIHTLRGDDGDPTLNPIQLDGERCGFKDGSYFALPPGGAAAAVSRHWGVGLRGIDLVHGLLHGAVPVFTRPVTGMLQMHPNCNELPTTRAVMCTSFSQKPDVPSALTVFGYPPSHLPWPCDSILSKYHPIVRSEQFTTFLRSALCDRNICCMGSCMGGDADPRLGAWVCLPSPCELPELADRIEELVPPLSICINGTSAHITAVCMTATFDLRVCVKYHAAPDEVLNPDTIALVDLPPVLQPTAPLTRLLLRTFLHPASPETITLPHILFTCKKCRHRVRNDPRHPPSTACVAVGHGYLAVRSKWIP